MGNLMTDNIFKMSKSGTIIKKNDDIITDWVNVKTIFIK